MSRNDRVKEAGEVEKDKEETDFDSSRIAAFFDLDGTLVALPSIEKRFFRILRGRREIPRKNYLSWLREAARLAPRGIQEMLQANKMYLRGVERIGERGAKDSVSLPAQKSGHQGQGQEPASRGAEKTFPRRDPRLPVPAFLVEGVERVGWHVKEGHAIVLVSGTLEPLAREAAKVLAAELEERGFTAAIRVCATRLEEKNGRWTGTILGEAMFGAAKARAVLRLVAEMNLDLAQCFAYGDSAADARILETVGKAFAVNPSKSLARMARERGWHMVQWGEKRVLTQRAQRTPSLRRGTRELARAMDHESEYETNGGERKMQMLKPMRSGRAASRSLG